MFGNLVVDFIGLAFLGLCIAVLGAPQQRRPGGFVRDI
jgi:hypothetical protein